MSDTPTPGEPELVVSEGAVIHPVAVDRLRSQLAAQDDDVVAVVAPFAAVPPGSSYRTVAEHAALLPLSVAVSADGSPPGAALVRPEVAHQMVDSRLTVARGTIMVDPGATSHDSMAEPGSGAPSTAQPAFPRAPVVLFLGLEHDPGRAIWARDMVNRLFDHDVEARLATTPLADPPHLSGPYVAGREAVRVLRPDVVVTLDDTALIEVPDWCDRRSTVIVGHTGERTLTTELVSWRIGAAEGRVRAYIGGAVEPGDLAALCSRLCAGPFPEPPSRDGIERPTPTFLHRPTRTKRRVFVVRGSGIPGERLQNFVDEAAAQGTDAFALGIEGDANLGDADVVVLAPDVDPDRARALIDERARRGRRTIVDLDDTSASLALAEHAGCATAPTPALATQARACGLHVIELPRFVTRAEADALRRTRRPSSKHAPTLLTITLDRHDPAALIALEAAVLVVLDDDPELVVELTASDPQAMPRLRTRERVRSSHDQAVEEPVGWRADVWLGSPTLEGGGPRPVIDAGLTGVPVVFAADTRGDVDDELVGRGAVVDVDDAYAWLAALRTALTPDDTTTLVLRTELLYGPRAGTAVVQRIVGWAGFPRDAAR